MSDRFSNVIDTVIIIFLVAALFFALIFAVISFAHCVDRNQMKTLEYRIVIEIKDGKYVQIEASK